MIDRSLQFEQAISGGERNTLLAYCQQQEQQNTAQEAETWRFLRLNIEEDARRCRHVDVDQLLTPTSSM